MRNATLPLRALIIIALLMSLSLLNCNNTRSSSKAPAPLEEQLQSNPQENVVNLTMETTYGNIELELWPDIAPKTVQNFIDLSAKGFYNGCHRQHSTLLVDLRGHIHID